MRLHASTPVLRWMEAGEGVPAGVTERSEVEAAVVEDQNAKVRVIPLLRWGQ